MMWDTVGDKRGVRCGCFLGRCVCAVMVAGTVGWVHRVVRGLVHDRTEWAVLDQRLSHTPVIVRVQGRAYVRVVPDSQATFTRLDRSQVPGQYAEVWQRR